MRQLQISPPVNCLIEYAKAGKQRASGGCAAVGLHRVDSDRRPCLLLLFIEERCWVRVCYCSFREWLRLFRKWFLAWCRFVPAEASYCAAPAERLSAVLLPSELPFLALASRGKYPAKYSADRDGWSPPVALISRESFPAVLEGAPSDPEWFRFVESRASVVRE
jgi:hypothetical protein